MPPKTNESTYPPEYTLGDIVSTEMRAREDAKIIPAFSPDLRSRQIQDLVQDVLSKRVFSAPERPVRSNGHIVSDDTNPDAAGIENAQAEGRTHKPKRVRSVALITAAAFLAGGASSSDLSTDGTSFSNSTSTMSSPNLSIIITPNSEAPAPSIDPNVTAPSPSVDPSVTPVPAVTEIAPVPQPTPEPPLPAEKFDYDFGTWNGFAHNSVPQIVLGIQKLITEAGVDAMGVQEATSVKRKYIQSEILDCPTCTFDGFMPDGSQTPIMWDQNKFEAIETGTRLLSERQPLDDGGAGGKELSPRILTYAVLRQKSLLPNQLTGREFYFINLHTVASVERNGKPNNKYPNRLEIYKNQMIALGVFLDEIAPTGRGAVVIGDFNFSYEDDRDNATDANKKNDFPYSPYNVLTPRGFICNYESAYSPNSGSHGNRQIDQIWVRGLQLKGTFFGPAQESDHLQTVASVTE